jgi:hypothetical protein
MADHLPKPGGHRKPNSAAKVTPPGYDHMKNCPTCRGTGKIRSGDSAKDMALRRV